MEQPKAMTTLAVVAPRLSLERRSKDDVLEHSSMGMLV